MQCRLSLMKEYKKTNRTHKKEHFPNPITERKRKRLRDCAERFSSCASANLWLPKVAAWFK